MLKAKAAPLVLLVQAALVAGFGLALRAGAMPLGVRGEWEWLRLPRAAVPGGLDLALGALVVAAYAGFAWAGMRFLAGAPTRRREALTVAGLWGAAIAVQALVPGAAPEGYGLSKWALVLHSPASSGYYTVAKAQVRDPWRFLAEYPAWIRRQDALHVGTHPPGLFLTAHAALAAMESRPAAARFVVDHLPASVEAGFRAIGQFEPLPRADRAAIAMMGALTLLACASTVVPLYLLARATLDAPAAWVAAALWPLVPSAILFQPDADTAFTVLSTTALALAAHAGARDSRTGRMLAFAAGLALALGMMFTLAFLVIGLIVALVLAASAGLAWKRRGLAILAVGSGFVALTLAAFALSGANPLVVWWWNQRNHARFYVEYPRSYFAWMRANPIELAVALGIPATVWAVLGLWPRRSVPPVSWATLFVLALLTLGGKSLSEVARLWLPMMPALLVAAGSGLRSFRGGPRTLAATVSLTGLETMILQATIQVVYPV